MSKRYKGAVISATPPTTSTSSASGVWTEQQFMQGVASGSWPALAGAPTIGTATAGALSASVAFTAPTYTGSGITGYTATSSPGGFTGTGASSPVTVSGLTAGTSYTFTVTATTAAGQSSASAASNSVTPAAPVYVEDVYSTYLYTGNSSTQTITNNIDLSTKGGLVWLKRRTSVGGTAGHRLYDTNRGVAAYLQSNATAAESSYNPNLLSAFLTTGFTLGNEGSENGSGDTYASWTFRKQPKFFDVVTYTGTGVARSIAHNLGSVPGCIIIKSTNLTSDWVVYHRSLGNTDYAKLNLTDASAQVPNYWNNTSPTSTEFTVKTSQDVNGDGQEYVAYLFAHDAGGFGLTGTDNVISCGSYTGTGSNPGPTINLGFEPQWILVKNTTDVFDWIVYDNMRGLPVSDVNTGNTKFLRPNTSGAEAGGATISPTATGFTLNTTYQGANFSGSNYIYIAIRRGPMKVPTSGTSVFNATANAGTGSTKFITTNFPVDLTIQSNRNDVISHFTDRLRGGGANASPRIYSQFTDAETNASAGRGINFDSNTGVTNLLTYNNGVGDNFIYYAMARAPSFFDEVCYTGTGSAATISHNLAAIPDLIIIKNRGVSSNWAVNVRSINTNNWVLNLEEDTARFNNALFSSAPTSTTMTFTGAQVNAANNAYVAYLFATCAGVSKVGSYTGTGAVQTINCGFTTGARFVLIKRTDSTGDWYTYDSARGITGSNDPYLFLNSTAAEVTGTNYVDTTGVGFQVTAAAPAAINANGGTFLFLAIA